MGAIVSLLNQKGGVGKTSTCHHLSGALAGAVGWVYAATLAVALVYLGEHYVVDLLAGAALTAAVRRSAPAFTPLAQGVARRVAALEALAHGTS